MRKVFSGITRNIRHGATVGASALLLTGVASAAQAQVYIGDAYGVDTVVAGIVGANIGDASLPSSGSATPVTNHLLNASVDVSAVSLLFGNATTGVIDSSTRGSGGFVDSKNTVNGLALPISLVETLNATTLTSETTATFSSALASGNSTITNLYYTDALGNHITLAANGTPNQVITSVPGVVSITLNEQLWNGAHSALTTNAIDVQTILGSHVIVSSSTAGFGGVSLTAAPEPGAVALIASLALPGLVGGIRLRRCRGLRVTEA